jgi:lysophospholipase L1-like esterase
MKYLGFVFRISIGVVFALVIVEIIFRIIAPDKNAARWNDRPAQYYLPESAANLRDRNYPSPKPANTFRIVVVGDSFTFGPNMQYEDTFPKRLEHWLNLNTEQKKVEVINLGTPGHSTRHEVEQVSKAIKELEADFIILEITLNDAELQPMDKKAQKAKFGAPYLKKPLFKHWKSARFFLQRLHNTQTHRLYIEYFNDLFNNNTTFNEFDSALGKIADLAKTSSASSKSVPLKAVIFPLFSFPMDQDKYPFVNLHSIIHTSLGKYGIEYLDLFDSYQNIPSIRLEVIPGKDPHPNEIAHRIAAESIYQWLRKSNYIDSSFFARRIYKKRDSVISRSIRIEQTNTVNK